MNINYLTISPIPPPPTEPPIASPMGDRPPTSKLKRYKFKKKKKRGECRQRQQKIKNIEYQLFSNFPISATAYGTATASLIPTTTPKKEKGINLKMKKGSILLKAENKNHKNQINHAKITVQTLCVCFCSDICTTLFINIWNIFNRNIFYLICYNINIFILVSNL